jgi:hypothetical protein
MPDDPWAEFRPAPAAADPWAEFRTTPRTSAMGAAAAGLVQGATANWADEMAAASAASGAERESVLSLPIGVARLGYEALTGHSGEATETYNKTLKQVREENKRLQGEHPIAYGAGEAAGTGAALVAAPMEKAGAALGARVLSGAKAGAAYGAAAGAGEGEGAANKTVNAATGAAGGAVAGGAAAPLGEAAKLAWDYAGRPIVSAVRGLREPATEAARRVAASLPGMKGAGPEGARYMGITEYRAARTGGEPVMLVDMGGERGTALLRSAANTSPEGREQIGAAVGGRYYEQSARAGDEIRDLIVGGANRAKSAAMLRAEYDAERKGAYQAAYNAGDKPIWSPELERLSAAPDVKTAITAAIRNWKNWQVIDGYGAMNPPVKVDVARGGILSIGGKGMLPYPNLQLWDYAARGLSDAAREARNAGKEQVAARYGALEAKLKSELDRLVPDFARARGIAATFFGGRNAQEAGELAFYGRMADGTRVDPGKIKLAMASMRPGEQDLFKESYAASLASKIEATPDRNDVTTRMFAGTQQRQVIDALFGQEGSRALEMFLRRETIYDAARKALGNSTTVRQFIEAGLAGGAAGAYFGQGDPRAIIEGVAAGGVSRTQLARSGAQKLIGWVDEKVAKEVADLLTSQDPAALRKGIDMAAKDDRVAQGIRDIAERMSRAALVSGVPRSNAFAPGGGSPLAAVGGP